MLAERPVPRSPVPIIPMFKVSFACLKSNTLVIAAAEVVTAAEAIAPLIIKSLLFISIFF